MHHVPQVESLMTCEYSYYLSNSLMNVMVAVAAITVLALQSTHCFLALQTYNATRGIHVNALHHS